MKKFRHLPFLLILTTSMPAPAQESNEIGTKQAEFATKLEQELAIQALRSGFTARQIGDFEGALEAYSIFLGVAPDHPKAPAVEREIEALNRIQSGWIKKIEPGAELTIWLVRETMRASTFEGTEELLQKALDADPKLWIAHALRAQNFVRVGKIKEASQSLDIAISLDPQKATTATSELKRDISRRLELIEVRELAVKLVEKGDLRGAADLLENSWKEDLSRVEFALQAANLRSRSKSFSGASRICNSVVEYLREHSEHPLANQSARIAATAEQASEASDIADRIIAARKASSNSAPSRKTKRSKSSSSSGKSPLDLYRSRTKK